MSSEAVRPPYAFGGITAMDRYMQDRRAGVEAGFLLPYLSDGMSLVDAGCGQGTITVGFAEILSLGQVAGFDLQESHIEFAKNLASSKGVTNTDFRVGDIFEPPFADSSFDVAYANAVLTHLSRPDDALDAIIGLVKPGGLIALRDRGADTVASGSGTEAFMRAAEIRMDVLDATSQNPYGSQRIGLVLNTISRKHGLAPLGVSASWQILPSAHFRAIGYLKPVPDQIAERAKALGVTTDAELADLVPGFEKWLGDADAFYAVPWFEVVARKPY